MLKTALISVWDKTGIVEFAKELNKLGIEILSSGGTGKLLKQNKILVTLISDYTGSPELLSGRVKTLHPKIHAGILALRNKSQLDELKKHNIKPIDLVIVNLYPFEKTIEKKPSLEEAQEQIDIGGSTLLRAAAKNFQNVIIICNPENYKEVIDELKHKKDVSKEKRKKLALEAFQHSAHYDTVISDYLSEGEFPEKLFLEFEKVQELRYGENPHQKGAFYKDNKVHESSIATAKQLHGKELSFNNILDANDAFELVKEFKEPTAAVIKHTNPCGVASASKIEYAYKKAHEVDPLSAFGSVVALNRDCNKETVALMKGLFVEVLIAPKFEKAALEILEQKKNIRLLETGPIKKTNLGFDMKKVVGGLLLQSRGFPEPKNLKVVTKRKPTEQELKNMLFAWKVNVHVKSNGIVIAKDDVAYGIGPGQTSRVEAVQIAGRHASKNAQGAALSSDAFFPFRDGIDEAAKAGVTAIIQPGGSIRDKEAIDAANEHNIAMVFSGIRLFKH